MLITVKYDLHVHSKIQKSGLKNNHIMQRLCHNDPFVTNHEHSFVLTIHPSNVESIHSKLIKSLLQPHTCTRHI